MHQEKQAVENPLPISIGMNWKISILLFFIGLAFGCGTSNQSEYHVANYASLESLAEVEDVINAGAGWKLIDLRKPEEFKQGHIPEAQNVWRTDIADTSYAYGGMMPTQLHMELLLGKLGINAADTIVVYDEKAECDAARLWWVLKFYGHPHIKLLNGGLKAWVAAKGQLSNSETNPAPTNYQFIAQPDSTIHASVNHVYSILGSAEIILLDTRGDEEFNGKLKDGAAKGGHIENAVNLDWAVAVDFNGTQKFLDSNQLIANFEAVGLNGEKPVITYCHSGVRSAHTLFVLTELLGYRNIKNYDGSWVEWSHRFSQ
jgi:thiosulfate/3-mercaptopyruvate sulfurtransferase